MQLYTRKSRKRVKKYRLMSPFLDIEKAGFVLVFFFFIIPTSSEKNL